MPELELAVREDLPAGFLAVGARELYRLLPQPTLIHLRGRAARPLFVSILLHGNEDTGLRAIQQVLTRHAQRELPRALSLFVGNISAAREGLRRLDGQPDYNRVWPGTAELPGPEGAVMAAVVAEMRERQPFASIDIHNNTGLNPHYGCVTRLDPATLHLAALFARIAVYFTRPLGVQTAAFAPLCPALTIECGKAGGTAGDIHAASLLDAALHLAAFPDRVPPREDLTLYHTVATVTIPPATSFGFGARDVDFDLPVGVDHWNFTDLPAGTRWGEVRAPGSPVSVTDTEGREVTSDYFEIEDRHLRLRRPVTPAMLTLDTRVVRQDCLCYLMEPYEL
jgi:succinylglutamate desuccinylase